MRRVNWDDIINPRNEVRIRQIWDIAARVTCVTSPSRNNYPAISLRTLQYLLANNSILNIHIVLMVFGAFKLPRPPRPTRAKYLIILGHGLHGRRRLPPALLFRLARLEPRDRVRTVGQRA